jgi:hypothetical protein
MVCARVPTMCWLGIVAALVIGPAANSEPIHLACEGAMRANEPRQERLDEKYLMSLAIDLNARTAKPEGHPSVPLKGSVEDEDIVAFASPRASDDVLNGRLNRRALREKAAGFLDLCFDAKRAAEITLQPIRRFGFDAAILFSDILVVPHALGQRVRFVEGEGPRLDALNDPAALQMLWPAIDHAILEPVYETIARVRQDLPPAVAFLGFCGAPWTLVPGIQSLSLKRSVIEPIHGDDHPPVGSLRRY